MTEQYVRAAIVKFCTWGEREHRRFTYDEIRPIPQVRPHELPTTGEIVTDCSGFATMAYQYAGAPDPNGNHYDGAGFTGTLLAHGTPITKPNVLPGDLIVFGEAPGHHVVVFIEVWHGAYMVASNGKQGDPAVTFLHREQAYQPSPVTFLRFPLT